MARRLALQQEEAAHFLKRKLHQNPTHASHHHNLAPLLEAHGDRDNALRHLKAAVECNPVDVDARNDYALALFRVGAWAKAVEQILAALQVNPSHLSARKNAVRGLGGRPARERARHLKCAPALRRFTGGVLRATRHVQAGSRARGNGSAHRAARRHGAPEPRANF